MNSTLKTRLFSDLCSRSVVTIVVETVLGVIICASTIIGNTLVLLVACRDKRPRSTANCLVISMAVSDFLIGVLCEPLSFAVIIGVQDYWTLGTFMCQFQGFLTILLLASSAFNVTLVAINRYIHVVRPTMHRRYVGQRATIVTILLNWFLSLLLAVSYLANGYKFFFHPGKLFCFIQFGSYYEIFFPILGTACILLLVSCYVSVFCHTSSHNRRIFAKRNETKEDTLRPNVQEVKLTKTLMTVVLGFSLCWSIMIIVNVVDFILGEYSLSRRTYVTHTYAAATSSAINPYIYGIANRQFRENFRKILRCKKRAES